MFAVMTQQEVTMSSREIAELTQSRHDNVKRSMERMSSKGVISFTPMVEPTIGGGKPTTIYHVNKRNSYVVVAQISPEFTAALVDRWQELENANQFRIPQSLPEALQLAADLAKQNEQVSRQLAIAAPKAEFADQIALAKRGVLLGQFAKSIGLGPVTLFRIMRELKILIPQGQNYNIPYQEFIDRGYFTIKQGTFETGEETRISHTPLITGKGEIWLQKKLLDAGYLKAVAAC
ncbi:phage antirepressor KilAC domain-containing protein [Vibrio cholerae]|uniref:phage antirepressor KilAC domain-containing protein n=1 Tax=Vibrio cholerae TaxID=666 RepID=UPI0011D6A4ED|nr:phage antirepressor KilAC domain-containing protein [Vibrio cholerae]MBJ6971786.1 phage antirepressor KilAC domain-containing protein [Vibrio cholerae]MDA5316672.1 phage antirepressor KilAC domain-containing protein [Vibrio cholerae]TXX76120.1 DNA-binding protein [Vibrio cholerae]GIA27321.1 Putative DNA-binding protein Roi [Vibrio cholerae]HDZ9226515.1 phage antirepressor KilAC domain-containing protein [Vibrio cholerae]